MDLQVEMFLDKEDTDQILVHNGGAIAECSSAIGYLLTYALIGGWEHFNLRRDGKSADMLAVYRKAERTFVMGAVWRPELGKYTFHS